MDCKKITTLDEAKAYFKSLWQPMDTDCVLNNLQKILNFLKSPAEELCLVNMQEKYLPFFYMIILDEEFLDTTFLTDECKVIVNEILNTLEVNKNSFTWEVSFSTQIAGIPVIFRKVYNKPHQIYVVERYERPIRLAFKETWIKTTLKFIKSSRLVLKYPEMPKQEALYLYKGILKLNEEEIGPDSLWAPVWEALNIFKLRYEYIVSINSTSFDYLKYVHFEKVTLKRKSCATEIENSIAPLNVQQPNIVTDDNKNIVKDIHGKAKDLLIPVVNHNELVKTLLQMNVTKSGTIVYTLKVDDSNTDTIEVNQTVHKEDGVNKLPIENEEAKSETILQNTASLSDDKISDVNLTLVVQGEKNTVDEHPDLNDPVNEDKVQSSDDTTTPDNPINDQNKTLCNEEVIMPELGSTVDKESDVIESCDNKEQLNINLPNNIEKESADEDHKQVTSLLDENANDNVKTQVLEPSDVNIAIDKMNLDACSTAIKEDTEMNITDENENINPFLKQITKKQNRASFLKEEEFIPADDTDEVDFITNDLVLVNKIKSILSAGPSEIFLCLTKGLDLRNVVKLPKKPKPPPSQKSILKKEQKLQRRFENKIRQKRRLIESVPSKFIQKSFKAILDFIDDELKASMEIVGLTLQEFNVLKTLHGFSPDIVPLEAIFDEKCYELATQIFDRLNEMDEFLEISHVNPSKIQRNPSTDATRQRAITFTKRPFKKPKSIRKPKSILEKMHLIPPKKRLVPERHGKTSEYNTSRSSSVSPARPVGSPRPKSQDSKSKSLELDEDSVKSGRLPIVPPGNVLVAMKAKMLEGLSVPLESDKAMRMMRLMGWNGGALGVRGIGLIEPIQPQLDVPKGVGLGHEKFKSTKLSISRLQRKVMHEKYLLDKRAETAKVNNDSENVTKSTNNDKNSRAVGNNNKDTVFDKSEEFATDISNKETFEVINNNYITENNAVEMPHSTDVAKKLNEKGGWLTNDSLIQKIKDKSLAVDTKVKDSGKEKVKGKRKEEEQRNRDMVRINHEKLMKSLQEIKDDGNGTWAVVSDGELEVYTYETDHRYMSDRIQFLVHLLDLMQCDENSFTVVSYMKKPSGQCLGFIDSVIWSLNHREELTPPPTGREGMIFDTCAREMKAHGHLILSYRFKKRFLTLVKSEDYSNTNLLLDEPPCTAEFELDTTHYMNDFRLYRDMPQDVKGVSRTKFFVNRVILDFVKSGNDERVYFCGRSCAEIRAYIISLISLLNRQMSLYQLGLGNSEHPLFREMLDLMKNHCLLFRFDSQESHFSKLQLVKLDLTKKCVICRLSSESNNHADQDVNQRDITDDNKEIDDIDIYPNRFHDSKDDVVDKSDDLIIEGSADTGKLNNENVLDDKEEDREGNNEKNIDEVYLIGEDWLESDRNDENNPENESASIIGLKTDENNSDDPQKLTLEKDSKIESNIIKDDEKNDAIANVSNAEMSSDFHNWPKRIKRDKTNEVVDQNTKWNTEERYESNTQAVPKRKVNKKKKAAKETVAEVISLNLSNSEANKSLNESKNTDDLSVNNEVDVEINTKQTRTNFVESNPVISAEVNIQERDENITKDKIEKSIVVKAIKTIDSNFKSLSDNSFPKNILIVHNNYPHFKIDRNAAKGLQSIIYEAIKKYKFLPRIKCYGLKDGGIVYTCYDFDSYIWLYDHLQWYKMLVYEHDLLSYTHVIRMKIYTFIELDIEGIFKNIEKIYDNIKTEFWKVIETKVLGDYYVLSIEIDNNSLESIKKENYSLFVGMDKVDISLL